MFRRWCSLYGNYSVFRLTADVVNKRILKIGKYSMKLGP